MPEFGGSAMQNACSDIPNSAPENEWEVWYRDTFDRECPPTCEVKGRGLASGLKELWARHLFETVTTGVMEGFSRFHLWTGQSRIDIDGPLAGARRLRQYLFGMKEYSYLGYVQEADAELLEKIASVHAELIQRGQSSSPILEAAMATENRAAFEAKLLTLN